MNVIDKILGYYTWYDFSKRHVISGGYGGNQILGYKNLDYLIGLTEPYTYAIGEKSSSGRVDIETYMCDLTREQDYYYQRIKRELLRKISQNRLNPYDFFCTLMQMQKIVCGCIPASLDVKSNETTNKFALLRKHSGELPCIILCKFRFEMDMVEGYLGEENCIKLNRKKDDTRQNGNLQSGEGKKQYLICTLASPQTDLKDFPGTFDIVFFSLSFKYDEYQRCVNYLKNNTQKKQVSIKRFTTNSGIDRKIMECLSRKNNLANEINSLYTDKTQLKKFVAEL